MPKLDELLNSYYSEKKDPSLPDNFNERIIGTISKAPIERMYSYHYLTAAMLIFLAYFNINIDGSNFNYVKDVTGAPIMNLSVYLIKNSVLIYSISAMYLAFYFDKLFRSKFLLNN